jgi:hypothetical protein
MTPARTSGNARRLPRETGTARATLRERDGRIYLGGLELHPIEEADDELTPWLLRVTRPDGIVGMTLRHLRDRHKENVKRGTDNPESFGEVVPFVVDFRDGGPGVMVRR